MGKSASRQSTSEGLKISRYLRIEYISPTLNMINHSVINQETPALLFIRAYHAHIDLRFEVAL